MKKEIAEKWIEALESGEYGQTKEVLHDDNGFCCLGVLCNVAQKEGLGKWDRFDQHSPFAFQPVGEDADPEETMLPRDIRDWAGMKSTDGTRGGKRKELWKLNDESGFNFKRIANIIRKEWESL